MIEIDEDLLRISAIKEFQRERPFGIRIDFQKKSFALFNRYFNELGCENAYDVKKLKMEECLYIEDLSVEGVEQLKESDHIVQVYYYDDLTHPYKDGVLDLKNLQIYNRRVRELSVFLGRVL